MFIQPTIIILVSFILGVFCQEFILAKFKKWAKQTKWKADDLVFDSLSNGVIVLGFVLAGLWLIIHLSFNLPGNISIVLGKSIFIGIIFLITLLLANFVSDLIRFYFKKGKLPSVSIFSGVIKGTIIIIGLTIILQKLDVSIAPILTTLGIGGIAIALALKDTLSNFFAGLQILISRKIKVGDYIQLSSGESGYVLDIDWRNTVIKTSDNNLIIVPNAKITSTIITNYYLPEKDLSIRIELGIPYEVDDLGKVEEVVLSVAKRVIADEFKQQDNFPEPKVYYYELGDSSIKMKVVIRLKELKDKRIVRDKFVKELISQFRQNNINLAYPRQVIQLVK